ncbi:hypothetical protein TRICHSKD4_0812 [Roseibium sp. TrichSKD4]|nr:hypothetical protein TRICHSKD4_0812 [Roseibium sp. TrichSKD4]
MEQYHILAEGHLTTREFSLGTRKVPCEVPAGHIFCAFKLKSAGACYCAAGT